MVSSDMWSGSLSPIPVGCLGEEGGLVIDIHYTNNKGGGVGHRRQPLVLHCHSQLKERGRMCQPTWATL